LGELRSPGYFPRTRSLSIVQRSIIHLYIFLHVCYYVFK
jgi:hypothetical protein